MTEMDKKQVLDNYNIVFEHLTKALAYMDGIGYHVDNGDIELSDLDRGIMERIHDDIESAHDLLMMHEKELKKNRR